MRIAIVVTHFPALSETFILNQIIDLIQQGHQVDIFADNPKADSKTHPDVTRYALLEQTYYRQGLSPNLLKRWLKGITLLAIQGWKAPQQLLRSLNSRRYGEYASSWFLPFSALQFAGKPAYDVVHCHFGPNGTKCALLKDIGLLTGKLVVTFHGYELSKNLLELKASFQEWLFPRADLLLPISEFWRDRLIEIGCNPDKVVVHHMGIDCERFSFQPRQLAAGESVRFITIGRFTDKKGIHYGIEAIAKVARQYPNLRYLIVGDGWKKTAYQKLAAEQGVADKVEFLGWKDQTELIEILQTCHILIAPSVTTETGDMEGIPVTLMEAMAMGMPVVSTLHSGIPELVDDGQSGFLVPERDAEALADKLSQLLAHPDMWPEMGRHGRLKVEQAFNLKTLNQRLVQLYAA